MRRISTVRRAVVVAVLGVTATVAAGAAPAAPAGGQIRVAYLSFAVANSYDAPMLAAAKAAAKKGNASITVFDASNGHVVSIAGQLGTQGYMFPDAVAR